MGPGILRGIILPATPPWAKSILGVLFWHHLYDPKIGRAGTAIRAIGACVEESNSHRQIRARQSTTGNANAGRGSRGLAQYRTWRLRVVVRRTAGGSPSEFGYTRHRSCAETQIEGITQRDSGSIALQRTNAKTQ